MAEFKSIAETLRRQRKDLEAQMDETSTSQGKTSELLTKIEELRKRAEITRVEPAPEAK